MPYIIYIEYMLYLIPYSIYSIQQIPHAYIASNIILYYLWTTS